MLILYNGMDYSSYVLYPEAVWLGCSSVASDCIVNVGRGWFVLKLSELESEERVWCAQITTQMRGLTSMSIMKSHCIGLEREGMGAWVW